MLTSLRVSASLLALGVSALCAQDPVPGSGLLGVYYTDQTLGAVGAVHRGEAVDVRWGSGVPDGAIAADHFSVRWLGALVAPTSGTYTITVRADDGVRLWLDGTLRIDRWIDQSATSYDTTITLSAGQVVSVRFEMYENGGDAEARLWWSGPGITAQAIPLSALALPVDTSPPQPASGVAAFYVSDRVASLTWTAGVDDVQIGMYTVLRDGVAIATAGGTSYTDRTVAPNQTYSYQIRTSDALGNTGGVSVPASVTTPAAPASGSGSGLAGSYYADLDLATAVATRLDARIDQNWGTGAPIAAVPGRPAAVRWLGRLLPRYSETYTVTMTANSNARVWVGGKLVVDGWGRVTDDQTRTWNRNVAMSAGVAQDLRVEYLDRSGNAEAHLYWESWSEPRAIIPTSQLYPEALPDPTSTALLSPLASATSPAWCEGRLGSDGLTVGATVGGAAATVVRPGGPSWYATTAAAGAPPGIVLVPGAPTTVTVRTTVPGGTPVDATQYLTWTPTVLSGATMSTVLTVRAGERLLFSASGVAASGALSVSASSPQPGVLENIGSYVAVANEGDAYRLPGTCDVAYGASGQFVYRASQSGVITFSNTVFGDPNAGANKTGYVRLPGATVQAVGAAGAPVPLAFTVPGVYTVIGQIAGAEVGRLQVCAVAVSLPVQLADMVGYRRSAVASIWPSAADSSVVLVASDPYHVEVAVTGGNSAQRQLAVRPYTLARQDLQARLGNGGPVIGNVPIRSFELSSSARVGMTFVQTMADGSTLNEGTLTLNPWTSDLTVQMRAFVSGVTFDDSLTTRAVLSSQFAVGSDGRGRYTYRMLMAPGSWYHSCHNVRVLQGRTQVSP